MFFHWSQIFVLPGINFSFNISKIHAYENISYHNLRESVGVGRFRVVWVCSLETQVPGDTCDKENWQGERFNFAKT